MRGAAPGPAWHAAKIAECGGLCTVNPRGGGVLMRVGTDAFEIEPLDLDNQCTPYTVSAHMLYENSDPFTLIEPGGVLDVHRRRSIRPSTPASPASPARAGPPALHHEAGGRRRRRLPDHHADRHRGSRRCWPTWMMFDDRHAAGAARRGSPPHSASEAGNFDVSLRSTAGTASSGRPPPAGHAAAAWRSA